MRVLVLNGPNMSRLGTREPEVYGTTTYAALVEACRTAGGQLGLEVDVRQTDSEGELIGWLHEAADGAVPVVVNAGAWSHTSYAIRDAVALRTAPAIEVHLSNIHAREAFRAVSVLSPVVDGVLVGLGVAGYLLALQWIGERVVDRG